MKRIQNKLDVYHPSSARSSSFQSTLPTLSKIRSNRDLIGSAKTLNLTNCDLIEKIRNRKKKNLVVPPAQVHDIIKFYFLPALGLQTNRKISLDLLNSPSNSQTFCDKLKRELLKTTAKLKTLNSQLRATQADKNSKLQEISIIKAKIINFTSNSMCFGSKTQKKNIIKTFGVNKETFDEFRAADKKKKKTTKKLYIERNKNSELKDNANTLKHWNSLFIMQSDIMGERLKGLYFACTGLSTQNLNQVLHQQVTTVIKNSQEIERKESEYLNQYTKSFKSINSKLKKGIRILKIRKNINEELKRQKIAVKDKLDKSSIDIQKAAEEKDQLETKFNEIAKKLDDFDLEYDKIKKKIREVKAKNRTNADNEEKFCSFCKQMYTERENYNWSCKVHTSEWNGTNYWCCGATKQISSGCQTSKHRSNDDQEEDEEMVMDKDKKKTISNLSKHRCMNCKETGHDFTTCSKDPNPQSLEQMALTTKKTKKLDRFSLSSLSQFKDLSYRDEYDEFFEIQMSRKEAVMETQAHIA
jgi:hypothetical protein